MQWLRCLFCFFLLIPAASAEIEWREYGPPGIVTQAVVGDVSREWVAAVGHQVYQSFDQGDSWEPLPTIPNSYDTARDIVIAGTSDTALLACTDAGSVYRFVQGATQWIEADQGIDPPPSGYARQCFDLALDPADLDEIYLACSTGVFATRDEGRSWRKVAAIENYFNPVQVEPAADGSVYVKTGTNGRPDRIEPDELTRTNFVCKPGLPCRSLDGAMIWPNPEDANELLMIFSNYPTQTRWSIYHSMDAGENWTEPTPAGGLGLPDHVTWELGEPTVVGVTATYSLNRSAMTWSLNWTRPIPTKYFPLALNEDRTSFLLGDQSRGVWKSVNLGNTWAYSSSGMPGYGGVYGLAAGNEDTLYVGMQSSGIWKTTDDGANWSAVNTGIAVDPVYAVSIRSLAVDPTNPNVLIAGTEVIGGLPASLYRTTNGGTTWTPVSPGPTALTYNIFFVPQSPQIVLAGTAGDGIWRSTNSGQTFTRVTDDVNIFRNCLDFAQEVGGKIYCPMIGGFNPTNGYAVSDNNGQTWTAVNDAASSSVAAHPTTGGTVLLGTGWYDSGIGVLRTTNNGTSWLPVNTGLPLRPYGAPGVYSIIRSIAANLAEPGKFYALLDIQGVYQTPNSGESWEGIHDESGNRLLYTNRNTGTLFLGTYSTGAWYAQAGDETLPTQTPTVSPTQTVGPTATPPPNFPPRATPTPTRPSTPEIALYPDLQCISPGSPRTGSPVQLALSVFNAGDSPLNNIRVNVYLQHENDPEQSTAQFDLPSIQSRMRLDIPVATTFNPSTPGNYTFRAVVDGNNQFAEGDETDNEAVIPFYVRATGIDATPPTGSISILGGSLVAPFNDISVSLPASDAGGSGLALMYLTAWAYDSGFGDFVRYYDGGWEPYLPNIDFFLYSVFPGDIHAIGVTYADGDGNMSDTYWDYVNYYPTGWTEFIWDGEVFYYPLALFAGSPANITIQHDIGDVDLYVIAPSTPVGFYDWASAQAGSVAENVSFNAPESGIYWLAVYGYDLSIYRLLVSASGKQESVLEIAHPPAKGERDVPVLDPPLVAGAIEREYYVPLPEADLNQDSLVNGNDLFYLSLKWRKGIGQPGYNALVGGVDQGAPTGSRSLIHWLHVWTAPGDAQ